MDETRLKRIVEQARDHDPDAWESLYRHAYPRLFAYARRRTPSDDAADDAVSEAFARAMGAIGRFRWSRSGIDGWLYGILRNVMLEHDRAGRRQVPTSFSEEAAQPVSAEPGPLETVLTVEREHAVRRAFEALPDDERELLELRVVGGLDAGAVGAVVGKRAGAVRMAQARALKHLRGRLEGRGMSERDDRLEDELRGALGEPGREPPADRVAGIRRMAEAHREEAARRPETRTVPRRRLLAGGLAAAGLGAAAGIGVFAAVDGGEDDVPLQPVEVADLAAGVQAEAQVIDHTWGLEYLLTVTGLPPDTTYNVVYRTTEDADISAGAFLGVPTTVVCRMTGPIRRSGLRAVEVRDPDGTVVLRSPLT